MIGSQVEMMNSIFAMVSKATRALGNGPNSKALTAPRLLEAKLISQICANLIRTYLLLFNASENDQPRTLLMAMLLRARKDEYVPIHVSSRRAVKLLCNAVITGIRRRSKDLDRCGLGS